MARLDCTQSLPPSWILCSWVCWPSWYSHMALLLACWWSGTFQKVPQWVPHHSRWQGSLPRRRHGSVPLLPLFWIAGTIVSGNVNDSRHFAGTSHLSSLTSFLAHRSSWRATGGVCDLTPCHSGSNVCRIFLNLWMLSWLGTQQICISLRMEVVWINPLPLVGLHLGRLSRQGCMIRVVAKWLLLALSLGSCRARFVLRFLQCGVLLSQPGKIFLWTDCNAVVLRLKRLLKGQEPKVNGAHFDLWIRIFWNLGWFSTWPNPGH